MNIGLGIDTGGTYTDCVLYDFDNKKVLFTAKALTTKNNLVEGIVNSLKILPKDILSKTKAVSLSTTLATNACVEEKFAKGRVILLGYHPKALYGYGGDYGLPNSDEVLSFEGGHDMQGNVVINPDWDEIKKRVLELKASTDAFGIVESWAIRNPEFEIKAKKLINMWTGLPVVCGHELSGEINSLRRAVTTLLNARLIPLIYDLIKSVELSINHMNIKAPLIIVRSDGTLMSRDFAINHPVETLLSGPAASVVGGCKSIQI